MTHPLTKPHHYITRISTIILATALLALSYGCNSRADALLERADSLMREHPDSALTIMESIDPDRLSDDEDKAFHALLLTEARYYTGPDQTDDSLINIAASYYHLRDKNPLRARAYYQKGMIHANAGQYSSAFLALMLAEETASALNDTRLLALIHRSIADTYCFIKNGKSAVDYYTKSYEEFCAVGDSVYADDALLDMARANYNSTNYQETVNILKRLLQRVETINYQAMIPYILDLLGDSYQALDNYSEAITVLTRLHDDYPSHMNPQSWNNLGLSYLYSGNMTKAEECEDSIKAMTDQQSWLSYKIADAHNNYQKALTLLKIEYQDGNDFFIEWVSRSAEKDLLDQYSRLKESTRQEKRANTIIFSLMIVILLLLVLIGYLTIRWLHTCNRRLADDNTKLMVDNLSLSTQKETLDKQVADNITAITQLKENIDRQNNEIIALRATLLSLNEEGEQLKREIEIKTEVCSRLQSRLSEAEMLLTKKENVISGTQVKLKEAVATQSDLINGLIETYYNLDSRKLPKHTLFDKFKEILSGLRHDMKNFKKFEKSVNRQLDNLMVNFKNDYPGLNNYEYDLFLFLVLGFSTKSICVFQDISKENFYNRKSKLLKKICNTESASVSEKYIKFF